MSGLPGFILLTVLAGLLAGCSMQVRRDKAAYRYRQSLIGQEDRDPLLPSTRGAGEPAAKPEPPKESGEVAARRCRERVGWRYDGDAGTATRALLKACLGREVKAEVLDGKGLKLRGKGPVSGDLVLFHNTYDRNANGSLDDTFTAAGLVVGITGPRVSFVYLRQGKANLGWLNLSQPNRRRLEQGDQVQNSYLRQVQPNDRADTPYLAGQLLAGFATL